MKVVQSWMKRTNEQPSYEVKTEKKDVMLKTN